MITYEPFWNTLKEKGITQYTLINNHDVTTSLLDRLRKNMHISTHTIDRLCKILDCEVGDIVKYINDDSTEKDNEEIK